MTMRIFVAEPMPSLNKGEAAILAGMLVSFEALGETKVYLASRSPEIDRVRYAGVVTLVEGSVPGEGGRLRRTVQAIGYACRHLLFGLLFKLIRDRAICLMRGAVWRAYLEADLIIVGHDNVFVNYPPLHIYVILLARLLNKPVIVYGASVGPFRGPLARWLSRMVLNRVDLITLRERLSADNLQRMGVSRPPIHVTADLAFLLPPASQEHIEALLAEIGVESGRPLIGLTCTRAMALCYCPAVSQDSAGTSYDVYVRFKARFVDCLTEAFGAQVLLLAHSYGPGPSLDDRKVNRDIYRLVRNKSAVRILDQEYTAQEVKGLIGQLTLLIGERTHSMIAAVSMGVPTIGISSRLRDAKTRGIIGLMLGQARWVLDIEDLDLEKLVEKVGEIWQELDLVKEDLGKRVPDVLIAAARNGELAGELVTGLLGEKRGS